VVALSAFLLGLMAQVVGVVLVHDAEEVHGILFVYVLELDFHLSLDQNQRSCLVDQLLQLMHLHMVVKYQNNFH
jgi:hypothetical protein